MNTQTWAAICEWAERHHAAASRIEFIRAQRSRDVDWSETETEDGYGGDVDRRMKMFGSLTLYSLALFLLSLTALFFSCRRADGAINFPVLVTAALPDTGCKRLGSPSGEAREVTTELRPGSAPDSTLAAGNNLSAWRNVKTHGVQRSNEGLQFDGRQDARLLLKLVQSRSGSNPAALNSLLRALAQIESGNNPRARGRHGEISEYQITPAVWKESSARLSRSLTLDHRLNSKLLASYHLGVIRASLRQAWRREPTPAEIYSAWNCGITATIKGQIPRATRERANRFVNLVSTLEKN